MSRSSVDRRRMLSALAFILPNILGFLAFTLLPMVVSLVMAFSNWDLKLHNMYRHEWPQFNGVENLERLFHEFNFWKYFGNTLYLMVGTPFAIGLSLLAAVMLTQRLDGGGPAAKHQLVLGAGIAGVVLLMAVVLLALAGAPSSAMLILLGGIVCCVLFFGTVIGSTLYRTLFYIPNFTAGVATFILWKKLYSPHTGPINQVLAPVIQAVQSAVLAVPGGTLQGLAWLCGMAFVLLLLWTAQSLLRGWRDGEVGDLSLGLGLGLLAIPACCASFMLHPGYFGWMAGGLTLIGLLALLTRGLLNGKDMPCPSMDMGVGSSLFLSSAVLCLAFGLLGLANVFYGLPARAATGLVPPEWLSSYEWAKPAMIFMGLWAAMGSQNMLLYIAAITNIAPELNEAAQIDGATGTQRFWHITWPQLAPVTLFIVIMSIIGGLQGGFEVARTMTAGGPAGSTTTLSYFIYTEGFETGRLGYASAVSWMIFLMVFVVTMFNWKFGNRYVDE